MQEVCVTGTAAARAEAVKVGSEEDDDTDFIRQKNKTACQKRNRKAEKLSQKDAARATAAATPKQSPSLKKKKKTRSKAPKATETLTETPIQKEEEELEEQEECSDDGHSDQDAADEDEELAMNPNHYRTQQGYRFEDESGEGSDFEELNVVFDHFNPKESDFGGIRQFLSNLLCGTPFNVGELVDIIIGQSGAVGTVVKVAGEEEVYGVTSVVSLTHYASTECVKQIKKFVLSKCPADLRPRLEKMCRSSEHGNTGFIVNERMVNMPNEMALPLMKGLFDELGWSQEDQVGLLAFRRACHSTTRNPAT